MTTSDAFGVYVHWPYCARICPYCDFNVYKQKSIDDAQWIDALTREIAHWAKFYSGRRLTSLYFGGGTPSLAPVSVLSAVIKACSDHWAFDDDIEITLEANPVDASRALFEGLRAIGINRLSLGVQSFQDDALAFLGRDHNGDQGRKALENAQKVFERVTFDLIYALPDQSLVQWEAALKEALQFGPTHLSLYELTIEPGTAFAQACAAGRWAPPDEDIRADLFDVTQDLTRNAGLHAYEVSNHARPGFESKHNQLYWRYGDYIGIGPGAHGRVCIDDHKHAVENHKRPDAYLDAIGVHGHGAHLKHRLTTEEMLMERFSMGLRLAEGIPLYADDPFYADDRRVDALRQLIGDGLLTDNCGTLRASPTGRPILNALLEAIFTAS